MSDDDVMISVRVELLRDGAVRTSLSGRNEVSGSIAPILIAGMLDQAAYDVRASTLNTVAPRKEEA